MLVRDISFDDPVENIVYDDVLLYQAEHLNGGNVLRFWESAQTFIVLGRTGKCSDEIKTNDVAKDRIPVLRRSSGGGTVVQGQGCLNYTLVLSKKTDPQIADLRKSYAYILSRIVDALDQLGVKSHYHPISDIALEDGQKKFSGNAQKRGRNFILHHGTILYDFDLELISAYLKYPHDVPEYRNQRSHQDFVSNINVASEDIKRELINIFSATEANHEVTEEEGKILSELKLKREILVGYP